ncbi:MAG: serine hydrolase [Deltaproteobacteria bacterium]|nr:MAG: serine hydrolase [Deltaproteobacteria bacterium]
MVIKREERLLIRYGKLFLRKKVFSGWCVGIYDKGQFSFIADGYCRTSNGTAVDKNSCFDLASLTKPLVTSLSLLSLVKEGKIDLQQTVGDFYPDNSRTHSYILGINLLSLLEHSSGLQAHIHFVNSNSKQGYKTRKKIIVQKILEEKPVYPPETKYIYSDLGYILLGDIIERASGMNLDEYWNTKIVQPLQLEENLFFNTDQSVETEGYCSTGRCSWSGRELCGLVHDDNCRFMGGVAGHAGLFGSAEALVSFCVQLLKIYRKSSSHPSLSLSFLEKRMQDGVDRWALGFDTPAASNSSAGSRFSRHTVGHLGFTGTSFWIDLDEERIVVLLTNRVWGRKDIRYIQRFRPVVHDLIVKGAATKRKEPRRQQ